jgi:hypothetical protein
MSPGWHSNALQIASKVESLIAFSLPFFIMEKLVIVIPTLSESGTSLIKFYQNINHFLVLIQGRFLMAFEVHPQWLQ